MATIVTSTVIPPIALIQTEGELVVSCNLSFSRIYDVVISHNDLNNEVGDITTLSTTDKTSVVAAINEMYTDFQSGALLQNYVGLLGSLTTTNKVSIVGSINELDGDIGDLSTLTTADKSSTVNAINEVNSGISNVGNLATLGTVNKTSIVAAINELETELGNIAGLTTTANDAASAINEHESDIGDILLLNTPIKTNLTLAINSVNDSLSDFLRIDGTNSAIADINMGNNKLVNLTDGVAISDAATVGQIGALSGSGNLGSLTTTDKTNLVNAINEVYANTAKMVYTNTQAFVPFTGDATGNLLSITAPTLFTSTITLNADPVAALEAATKQYVDNLSLGLSWKSPVKAATTGNVGLTGTASQDGIAINNGDRILVKEQTNPIENGIYIVGSPWVRADDSDSSFDVEGSSVFVQQGTVNADLVFTQNFDNVVLGTTAINWVQLSGSTAGTMQLSGGTMTGDLSLGGNNLIGVEQTEFNNQTYTWPTNNGNPNEQLTSNGSGVLSWTADSSLGSSNQTLTAARSITMGGNNLTFDGVGDVIINDSGLISAIGITASSVSTFNGSTYLNSFAVFSHETIFDRSPKMTPEAFSLAGNFTVNMNSAAIKNITLSGNSTLTGFINFEVGDVGKSFILNINHQGFTIGWPALFDWGDAGSPTLTTTAGKASKIGFSVESLTKVHSWVIGTGFSV